MAFKTPKDIVQAAFGSCCVKVDLSPAKMLVMGFLAGGYIALGGLLAIIVGRGVNPPAPAPAIFGPGLEKFIFAAVFPVGLMLVVIAGAELFTGNCAIIPTGCLAGKARWTGMFKNWGLVYLGNFIGSLFVAYFLAYATGLVAKDPWLAGTKAIAEAKVALPFWQAFWRGVGCNWLVCLAVWMAIASDDIVGKVWAIWFPIDHYGNLTDAQDIRFSTSLGSLDVGANPVSTTNGKAIASLKGSTGGGEAVVTVKAAGMQKEIRITIRSYAILILKKEVMTEATGQECGLPDNSEANCYRLQWTWDGVLRDQEYFDVRVWGPGEIKDDVNTCSVAAWPRLTGWERIQEQLAVEKQRQKGLYSYHLALPSNMNNTRPQLNYETVVQWTIAVVVNDTELGLVTVSESAPE